MIDSSSRYLILGGNGMLGKDLQTIFHDRDFVALDRDEVDINNSEQLRKKIIEIEPDVIINAAAFTNVEACEDARQECMQINGYSVGILASICREYGILLVHLSTDYVFNGEKKSGYNEEDLTSPINVYGESKKLGEDLLIEEMELEINDEDLPDGKYFLIRTSWLFGKHGVNFIEKILAKMRSGESWKVVDDQWGSPTFTIDLAKQIKWLVESNEYEYGIYHITNSGQATWYEFAMTILAKFKLENLISQCSSKEFVTKAKRPTFSVLKNTKLPELRNWKEAVLEYLSDVVN